MKRTSFFFVLLATFLCSSILAKEADAPLYETIENQAKIPILTPSLSERKISKIRLKNGLEAILVSDPQLRQSAVSLTVNTGSWNEPADHPGLAHFLEHMLFLGTKKFPKEGEYQTYLTEHGGQGNAFTTNDTTSYLFIVNNDGLEGALDRFSQFFKEPIFSPSGVGREIKAIDQEFSKNLENDDFREIFVAKELANEKHPYHRFNAGNSISLINTSREDLIEWYGKNYSANLMHLIVYSTLPLDTLTSLIVKDFSGIPTHNAVPLKLDPELKPHMDDELGTITFIEPIKHIHQLSLIWDLPAKFAQVSDSQPESLVCHVLGHEGKESLLAELKREKLAESIKCGSGKLGPQMMQFYIEIQLTDEGMKKYDVVIERVFQAIKGFQQKGVPRYLYDEIKRMALIHYQYQPRKDGFDQIEKDAMAIVEENIATYPEKTLIVQKYDPDLVLELLSYLTPKRAIILLSAPSALTGKQPDRAEKWTKTPYRTEAIPQEWMKRWEGTAVHTNMDLPPPNIFIPKKLELIPQNQPAEAFPHPKAIIDDSKALIYFAPDRFYKVPEIYAWFEIKTPAIQNGKALSVVLGDLFVKSVEEALNKYSYDAQMAGLDYQLETTDNGIGITLKGYSENAPLLFAEIVKRLKEIHPSDDKFDLYKQSLLRQYRNESKESPLVQAADIFKSAIYKNYSTDKQKAAAIRKVNFEMFNEFVTGIFDQTYVEGLVFGNMTEDEAKSLSGMLLPMLGDKPYPNEDRWKKQVIELPEASGPYYLQANTKSKGNAVILGIEAAGFSFKERAAQQLLMHVMGEPFFEQLRTKQQTGYTVGSTDEEIERRLFSTFIVLSNTHNTRDLLARFELFIESFLQEMDKSSLTEKTFDTTKKALISLLRQPQNNMEELGKLLKMFAFKYSGDFDWLKKRIEGYEALTYPEFLSIAKKMMGRSNKKRFAVLMQGLIPENVAFDYIRIDHLNALRKKSTFTNRD